MARTRNIKPDDFLDDVLGAEDFPIEAHFLRVGLNCLADKEGRLEDRPQKIRAQIFPYRSSLDVETLLARLVQANSIRRYSVGGQRFIQLVGFAESQNPHPNEAKSRLPGPELHDGGIDTPAHVITGAIQKPREDTPGRHLISDPGSLISDPGSLISSHPPAAEEGGDRGGTDDGLQQPLLTSVPPAGPRAEDLQALWNRLAVPKKLGRWVKITEDQRRIARLAFKTCSDLPTWEAWLTAEFQNPWNLGDNPSGWRADVEWLLRVKTRNKVANFDPAHAPRRPSGAQHGTYTEGETLTAEDINGVAGGAP